MKPLHPIAEPIVAELDLVAELRTLPAGCTFLDAELMHAADVVVTLARETVRAHELALQHVRTGDSMLRELAVLNMMHGQARGVALMLRRLGSPVLVEMLEAADEVAFALNHFGARERDRLFSSVVKSVTFGDVRPLDPEVV